MTELSAEARALIERVGGADGPDAERRRRVKRHLVAALASAGAGLGGITQVAAATAHASTTGVVSAASAKLSAGKLLLWLATGAAAGTLVASPAVVWRMAASSPAPAHEIAAKPLATGVAEPKAPPVAPPVAAVIPAPVDEPSTPSTAQEANAPGSAKPAPRAVPAPPSLAEETRLLESAQRELAAHRPSAALSLLDEHSRRFGRGALAEERSFARVLSLCALGRAEDARAAAAAFFVSWPSSPLLPRLRASCAVSRTEGEPPLSR